MQFDEDIFNDTFLKLTNKYDLLTEERNQELQQIEIILRSIIIDLRNRDITL